MGIEQPDRTLEFDRQSPALTTIHRRTAMPGQTHALRQLRAPSLTVAQLETHHAVGILRQPRHLSFDPTGFAIQSR
ncbi:hypothetical protein D3C80_1905430 [compost metagenome]